MSTWAIGDVQGCLEPLERLLARLGFDDACDELWFVGDLVNRGPDSLGVLRLLHSVRRAVRVVLGNHDLHLLAVAAGAQALTRKDTFAAVLDAPDAAELLAWLRAQPLLHHDAGRSTAMTHAGIPPQWSLNDALRLASEVEAVLRSPQAGGYLRDMYGNEPELWSEDLAGTARLRTITNYFTRMRFVDARGALDLHSKEGLGTAPEGFRPWFAAPDPRWSGTRLLFGHWAALGGRCDVEGVEALDAGCVWGGELVALDLDTGVRTGCRCG